MAHRRTIGSLFRRTRKGKPEDRWSISYRVDGRRVTERAYTDKRASEQLLAQRLREVARGEVLEGAPPRRRRVPAPLALHEDPIETAIAALRAPHAGLQQLGACALAYLAGAGRRLEADELAVAAQVAEKTTDQPTRRVLAAVLAPSRPEMHRPEGGPVR